MHVDPFKPKLKAPGTKRLKLNTMFCFQDLLLNSTCAATRRRRWLTATTRRR